MNSDTELRRLLGKTFCSTEMTPYQGNNVRSATHRMPFSKIVKVGANWPPIRQLGYLFFLKFFSSISSSPTVSKISLCVI